MSLSMSIPSVETDLARLLAAGLYPRRDACAVTWCHRDGGRPATVAEMGAAFGRPRFGWSGAGRFLAAAEQYFAERSENPGPDRSEPGAK